MKKIALCVMIALSMYVFSGCAAVVAGSLLSMADSATKKNKIELKNSIRMTNIQREANGLEPLCECEEIYFVNKSLARELGEDCRIRIYAYESGDNEAFDINWVPSDSLMGKYNEPKIRAERLSKSLSRER